MRRAVDWMHQGLPADPLWGPLFLSTMTHGVLANQVFPRVYTAEELRRIEADVLFVFGAREAIYGDLEAAVRSTHERMPEAKVVIVPEAHHIAALAQPEVVNGHLLAFFAQQHRRAA
jgi:pimeloyl-ACP methyl ester carboxylesterase